MKKYLSPALQTLAILIVFLLLLTAALLTEHPWWSLTGLSLLGVVSLYQVYRPFWTKSLTLLSMIILALGLFVLGRPYKNQSLMNDITEVVLDGLAVKTQLTSPIGQTKIPVLVYHKVVEQPATDNPFEYPLSLFEAQMTHLKKEGYTTLSLADYKNILLGNQPAPDKPILLTFDDITADFYDNILPILTANEQTATLFAVSDWVDKPNYLTKEQLLEIEQAGFAIQNHTKTHPRLSQLSLSDQEQELLTAKNRLEDFLKQDITTIATPYGNHNADTLAVAKFLQTDLVFTGLSGIPSSDLSDPYQLPRIGLLQSHSFEEFLAMLR